MCNMDSAQPKMIMKSKLNILIKMKVIPIIFIVTVEIIKKTLIINLLFNSYK